MKKFKYLHKESQQFKLKKDYGLQSNLGQQLEQKVKNYTILLRRRNKIKKKDLEENKNNDLNFSFNSSSSEDYSNDYYEKFLLQLNDLKQSHNTVTINKINPLKKSKETSYKNNKRVHSDKLNNYLKEKTIMNEILYNKQEPKNSNNNLLSLKSDKSILKEEKTINTFKNKQKSVNYSTNVKQNNNNNINQKEKVNNLTSISKEIKSYINEEPYSDLKLDNIISPINIHNPVKDDSNIFQSKIDENNNKTKYYSSVKKTPFKKNDNALSYSIKKNNNNNNQKVKRQTSLKNENLKEKDKKSLIRKITNSLETNVNNNQNKNLFNPKKIEVENLLKKKNKKVKKENNNLKDNVIIEIPTPSLKNEIKIIEKKKKLFCCLPLC